MLSGHGERRASAWSAVLLPTTLLVAVGFATALGCKDDKPVSEASGAEVAAAVGSNPDDETELLGRRDALLETRRALALKRAELDDKRAELEASGQDTAVIEKQVSELVIKEREVEKATIEYSDELLRRVKDQQSQLASVAGTLSGEARVTVREGALASREGVLARREREVAKREAELATREEQLATKWKDSCASSGPIFSLPAAPSGTKYKKRDVERHLKKASKAMRKRGILTADLPAAVRNLSKAAQKAMRKGDYTQAYYYAEQMAGGVDQLRINRNFVKAKYDRVRASVSGNLSDRDAKVLTKITSDFGDGRYKSANKQLNELISRQ